MNNGVMIVCDGSNGAGKTTVIKAIEEFLIDSGHEVVLTREPGGTPIGEKLREIILNNDNPEMTDLTELMLFGAGRAQHIHEKIKPSLAAGKIVLCDRFDAATFSFQHYARGLDYDLVKSVNDLAVGSFKPDLNIVLDLDPQIGLERVRGRGDELDRLEDEEMSFLIRARDGYLKQAENDPELFEIIDASASLEEVTRKALVTVEKLLSRMQS
jgi:dTMP kinase